MRFMSGVVVAVGLLGCGGSEADQAPFETVGHTDQEIVGGVEARPNSHPWIVSLQKKYGSHFCGGSLVRVSNTKEESDIVLTAAHCVYDGYSNVTASAGAHDLYRPTSTQVTARVTVAVYHPQYNPNRTLNDIAVLKLDKPIKFGTSVAGACGQSSGMRPNLGPQLAGGNTRVPVCLPASGERVADNTMATVAGWGLTREGGYDTSSILLQVGVPVLNHRDVANSYRTQGIVIDESAMFGAGYQQGGKDTCQGDSGGPLVVNGSQGFVLQGIVSFGVGCARAGLPGIYTRVSNYIPWINMQIRTLSAVR
ncbi:serine protease [Corallococcus sp. AB011P]|uniref:serine protease n=1 Tax=unclassified Corallococcus TaxID=2685029 RepID=UPI000EA11854|nr:MULTISPECIES: serine protease [unclassified Corallococcus]RKG55502.1 serine protease [Corallococcus sp. AB011P]RKH88255.1 serine protease [Corallococcus sp. AB045]